MKVGHVRNPRTAWRRVEDEVLVISSDRNDVTVLNDTAGRVWELLEGDRDVDEIVGVLVDEFATDPETARRDLVTFLRDMTSRGLVVPEDR